MTGGLWSLASGVLQRADRRTGNKGYYATATIRVGGGDAAQWGGVIAFAEAAARLLALHAGDPVSASGRGEVRSWTGGDGAERHGLSIVTSAIAAARWKRRQRVGTPRVRPRPAYSPQRRDSDDAELPVDPVADLWPARAP